MISRGGWETEQRGIGMGGAVMWRKGAAELASIFNHQGSPFERIRIPKDRGLLIGPPPLLKGCTRILLLARPPLLGGTSIYTVQIWLPKLQAVLRGWISKHGRQTARLSSEEIAIWQ